LCLVKISRRICPGYRQSRIVSPLLSAIAKVNGKSRRTLRRGLVEEIDTNKHMNTKGSTETEGSSDSDEPDLDVDVVDVCNSNLVKFAGLWSAVDKKDGSHAQASIQCFKDGEFRQITWNRSFAYYDHVILLQKRILWVTCGKIRGYPIGGSVTVNFGQLLLDLSFVLIII